MKLINTTRVSEFSSELLKKKLITFDESSHLMLLSRDQANNRAILILTELRKESRRNHEWDDRRIDVVLQDAITEIETLY